MEREQEDPWSQLQGYQQQHKSEKVPKGGEDGVSNLDAVAAAGAFLLGHSWSSLVQPQKVQVQGMAGLMKADCALTFLEKVG